MNDDAGFDDNLANKNFSQMIHGDVTWDTHNPYSAIRN